MRKRRRRLYLTQAEKAVMSDRWKRGESLHAIARLLDTSHTSIRRNLAATGGIRPLQRLRGCTTPLRSASNTDVELARWERFRVVFPAEHTCNEFGSYNVVVDAVDVSDSVIASDSCQFTLPPSANFDVYVTFIDRLPAYALNCPKMLLLQLDQL